VILDAVLYIFETSFEVHFPEMWLECIFKDALKMLQRYKNVRPLAAGKKCENISVVTKKNCGETQNLPR